MKISFDSVSREYATLWDMMEIVRDEAAMTKTADRIIAFRAAYEEVEKRTGVPWYFVGICDMREGGGGARRHLHNGDSLERPTVQVPANRPPGKGPFTFTQSAVDALQIKGLDKIRSWPIERLAYEFERFNGFGYRSKQINIPSPYLWGGTNHQQPGKYIRDHVFSKAVMDTQHGCMPLLKLISQQCSLAIPSIYGATENAVEPSPASNVMATIPEPAPLKASGTVWGTVTGALAGGIAYMDQAMSGLLEWAAKLTELSPVQSALAGMGGNVKSMSLGLGVGAAVYVVSRRVKAAQEGKAG